MTTAHPTLTYYEKIVDRNTRKIYVSGARGYRDDIRRNVANSNDLCLLMTTNTTEEECNKIDKCVGFIDGVCLVSYTALNFPEDSNTAAYNYTYKEKIYKRVLFDFMETNGIATIITIISITVLQGFGFWFYGRGSAPKIINITLRRRRNKINPAQEQQQQQETDKLLQNKDDKDANNEEKSF
jgi:hypothetical protein